MYPTKEEFEDLLRSRSLDRIVDDYLLTGIPFSFADRPDVYQRMIGELAKGLDVPKQDICVVGSARIGFSLSPPDFGAPFNEYSDIDVVVVSPTWFDSSWMDMLMNRRAPWSKLKPATKTSVIKHREKYYIYNGWIYPDSVAETLEFGQRWLTTFNGLSRIPHLSSLPIGGRLYRTWDHVRVYHSRGLRKILEGMASPSEATGAHS